MHLTQNGSESNALCGLPLMNINIQVKDNIFVRLHQKYRSLGDPTPNDPTEQNNNRNRAHPRGVSTRN